MKNILVKIGIFVGIIAIGVILLNAPYFLKQFKFMFGITKVDQQVPSVQNNSGVEVGEPNQLQIPSLNIIAPVQYVTEINEDVFQVALRDGVVHYPGTAEFGQVGNSYVFGHSSDFALAEGNFKTVFALLPRIQKGAEIVVSDKEGRIYRYEVIDQMVVNNEDMHVLDQKEYKEKLLTLQTSYPVGTALQRYIVIARLKE